MDAEYDSNADPIDRYLTAIREPVGDLRLREAMLAQTKRVLRQRRRLRQIGLVAALTACYAAGLVTMKLAMLPGSSRATQFVQAQEQGSDGLPPSPAPAAPPPEPKPQETSAVAMEWQAIDNPEERSKLYRQAGDRYLEEAGDMESALRCYRGALENASDKDLIISTGDNWLLMALKQAKQMEKRHANNDG